MSIAVFAGSFDPFTLGHLDILESGAEIFDKVIVAVAKNINKQGFLPVEVRVKLIEECVAGFKNVEVTAYDGLTVEFAKSVGANVLLRGLRNEQDFSYELQISQTNSAISEDIKTVFLVTKPEHSYISSSAVREILKFQGDVSKLVPEVVNNYLKAQ